LIDRQQRRVYFWRDSARLNPSLAQPDIGNPAQSSQSKLRKCTNAKVIVEPMAYRLFHQSYFEWLREQSPNSIHAVCTDPPYGLVEFSDRELEKLRAGRGGVWRLPPNINGSQRAPLPRFTVLTSEQQKAVAKYFFEWGEQLITVIVPGGHVIVAGHAILQHHVQGAMSQVGFEVRGAVIRLYQGFRGGDRPKNAELEFPDVSVTPKGGYEPWMLFRKPISEGTVAANLRKWKTGG
jgi:site-specific DNA-methyltransferase (adenine-specific)